MKYVITESRLFNLVENYLNEKYSNLEEETYTQVIGTRRVLLKYWVKFGKPVLFENCSGGFDKGEPIKSLQVRKEDFREVSSIFGLDHEVIKEFYLMWAEKNFGYKYVNLLAMSIV